MKNKSKLNESRNISQYFSNTLEQTNIIRNSKKNIHFTINNIIDENASSLPVLANHRMPNIMKSVESVPFFDEFDGKKSSYEKYMETVVNDKKTKRQERLVRYSILFYSSFYNANILQDRVKTPQSDKSSKKHSTLDRKDIISPSTIKSPKNSKIQKRKLKLTDTERKEVNQDLAVLKKSSATDREMYESDRYYEDPGVINAQMAAKMGIHYPPDFEQDFEELRGDEADEEQRRLSKFKPSYLT